MILKKTQVKVFQVKAICDCGGELVHIPGRSVMCGSGKCGIPHKCGNIERIAGYYPKIRYEDVVTDQLEQAPQESPKNSQ
jgi:hypothetical protein